MKLADGSTVTGPLVRPGDLGRKIQGGILGTANTSGTLSGVMEGVNMEFTFSSISKNGVVSRSRLTGTFTSDDFEATMDVLMIGNKSYLGGSIIGIISSIDESKYDWIELDPSSENPAIAEMAKENMSDLVDTRAMTQVLYSASSVIDAGPGEVSGVAVDKYMIVLKGPIFDSVTGKPTSATKNRTGTGMELSVDSKGRIYRLSGAEGGNSDEAIHFVVKSYDEPVTIEDPDPSRVTNG